MSISLNKHLDRIRRIGHETSKKNGHYHRMAALSAIARRKKKELQTK